MRRRRSRGTWFPVIGTQPSEELSYAPIRLSLAVPAADGFEQVVTGIVPVTFDEPQEGEDLVPGADALSEILGNEYILKRIVGKCFVSRTYIAARDSQSQAEQFLQDWPLLLVGCGFFVARAQDSQDPGGQALPIGTTGNSAINEEKIWENYSPLALSTIREPWIWRRTWLLGNPAIDAINQTLIQTVSNNAAYRGYSVDYPSNNVAYGSVLDGPHLDSRVKRRVGQDDRLWFAVGVKPLNNINPVVSTGDIVSDTHVDILLDYRIFGSLRKAKNRSAF